MKGFNCNLKPKRKSELQLALSISLIDGYGYELFGLFLKGRVFFELYTSIISFDNLNEEKHEAI